MYVLIITLKLIPAAIFSQSSGIVVKNHVDFREEIILEHTHNSVGIFSQRYLHGRLICKWLGTALVYKGS